MYIRIKVYFSFNLFSSFTTVIKESTLALLHQYVTSSEGRRLRKLACGKFFMIHMTHVCVCLVKGNVYVFILYKCYGLVRTTTSQYRLSVQLFSVLYRLSVQLCSDLVRASSVSLSSSLLACLVLNRVVIYSFILQTNDFVIFVLYIK